MYSPISIWEQYKNDNHQDIRGMVQMSSSRSLLGQQRDTIIEINQDPSTGSTSRTELQQLLNDRERSNYLALCVPLYDAALKGDWRAAQNVIQQRSGVLSESMTARGDRALHIAAAAKHTAFVKKLVGQMSKDELALQNDHKNTALFFAAASGVVEIAKVMTEKNQGLPLIRGSGEMIPLQVAAFLGRRDMVSYLYSVTPFDELTPDDRIELLTATIDKDMYDIALEILNKDKMLATHRDSDGKTALHVLAQKPLTIITGESQLGSWNRLITWLFKGYHNKDLMRKLACQLVEDLWAQVRQLQVSEMQKLIEEPSLLHDAAEVGNADFLVVLIRKYPDLIWQVDQKRRTIFHIAVEKRHESVFSLIHETGSIKDLVVNYEDQEERNNILHLAGKLAPSTRLSIVSGAALQMQRELLWFKEVEKIVPSSHAQKENAIGKTPRALFSEEHQQLLKDGEKWMKDTATSCMLVATLIATVVFAAAFTVPGGSDGKTGIPNFIRKKLFTCFVISDAVALFTSTSSIVTFLSLLTSRYAEDDFLVSLPRRLMIGLTALLMSLASMVLAFTATFFLLYSNKSQWVPKFIAASACVPVILFAWQHYKLLFDTIRSTYGSRFLFRPGKHRLY